MPIYEYQCKACDAKFEKLVRSMSAAGDDGGATCPACGSSKTARALSVFAVAAEGPGKSAGGGADPGPMCGRCGGPGPCGMGN